VSNDSCRPTYLHLTSYDSRAGGGKGGMEAQRKGEEERRSRGQNLSNLSIFRGTEGKRGELCKLISLNNNTYYYHIYILLSETKTSKGGGGGGEGLAGKGTRSSLAFFLNLPSLCPLFLRKGKEEKGKVGKGQERGRRCPFPLFPLRLADEVKEMGKEI